jgi:hypothetical protein
MMLTENDMCKKIYQNHRTAVSEGIEKLEEIAVPRKHRIEPWQITRDK